MSVSELKQIIEKGLAHAGMVTSEEITEKIADFSRGLPHFTHLVGRFSALEAASKGRKEILPEDLALAIKESVVDYSHSIRKSYNSATYSPQENLYKEVLLSAALAKKDELGFFFAGDLRAPMQRVTGKPYEIPAYSRHLYDFCDDARGKVLERTGTKKKFRFRFVNPLMEPFVVLKGVADGLVKD
jgi:hypothetical protein